MRVGAFLSVPVLLLLIVGCGTSGNRYRMTGPPNMGGPIAEERAGQIANEQTGSFFYGRRYYVHKTRFWGYLRKPRESASRSRLVLMNEERTRNPDRLPENGPPGRRYGFDQNYEYRIWGSFTGDTAYDPNSNQFLPEFKPTRFEVVDRNPGWLFSPEDYYDPYRFTLLP